MAKSARIGLILVVSCLSGCVTAESSYEQARTSNTESAYRGFLSRYPQHPLAEQARDKIDELRFLEASKTNTTKGYRDFIAKHPRSPRLQTARQRLEAAEAVECAAAVAAAVQRGDYGALAALEPAAREHGFTAAAADARTELDRYEIITAGSGGVVLASSQADQSMLDNAKAVVQVRCAAGTSTSDSLATLLSRNVMDAAIRKSDGASSEPANADSQAWMESLGQTLAKPSPQSGSVAATDLYLFPETDEDSVLFRDGALELRDRVDGVKTIRQRDGGGLRFQVEHGGKDDGALVATLRSLKRCKQEDQVFSLLENPSTDGAASYCSVVLVLEMPARDRLCVLYARGALWIIGSNGNAVTDVRVGSSKIPVLVTGSARLPKDRWVTVGPGTAARGGELRFEETRVLLVEGTQIARRRP